ncbi:hypothetical protein [Mariniflexile sp. AS56]|uniref:hypothetical protein n=1 Tax=Mariniflexile sp. AS56 TaxID=3063957 RepID=UPI0026EDB85A|nr:hypothetical protein [Mariniflexile sp. AS56]MDO7172133.1 hypothetical protein [Mariniflexile sp. AS56]
MNLKSKLLFEISKITLEIETSYPELYQFLDENPITIPNEGRLHIDDVSLEKYLEALRTVLEKYKEEHP